MGQITYKETTTRPPDVKVFFSPGDYDHALRSYCAARAWCVVTGQHLRQDVYGIINRPHHPQCPSRVRVVPPELIYVGGWSLTLDIWCADAMAIEWVRGLPAPEGAQIAVVGAEKYAARILTPNAENKIAKLTYDLTQLGKELHAIIKQDSRQVSLFANDQQEEAA